MTLAKSQNVPIRCILFTADPALCEHNNAVRALNNGVVSQAVLAHGKLSPLGGKRLDLTLVVCLQMNPEGRSLVPKMAFSSFQSRFRTPSTEEGFEDIIRVDFKVRKRHRPGEQPALRKELTPVFCQTLQFTGSLESRKVWSRYWV